MKEWMNKANCLDTDVDFFVMDSETIITEKGRADEIAAAKKLCFSCSVRRNCLSDALKEEERFGVFGGLDEFQLRTVLGVDQYGKPISNNKTSGAIACPYCTSDEVVVTSRKRTSRHLRCGTCAFEWHTRTPSKTIRIEIDDENMDGRI